MLNNKKNNAYIDLIRLLSACGVLLVHLGNEMQLKGKLKEITGSGIHGVEIFMLISGFLIMSTLGKRETLKQFYTKRFFRIAPVYYFVIIFSIIYLNINKVQFEPDSIGWARYFTFTSTLLPSNDPNWINWGATWTISSFVLFYLIAPLLYKIINTYNKAIVYIGFQILVSFYLLDDVYNIVGKILGVDLTSVLGYSPIINLSYFAFGIAAYFAINENKTFNYIIFLSILLIVQQSGFTYGFSRIPYTIAGTIMILLLNNRELNNQKVSRAITSLSKYSYTLYLVHPLTVYVFGSYKINFSNTYNYLIALTLVIFIVTFLTYHIIEKPLGTIPNKILKCKKK